jgi:hypothetical protein
MLGECSHEENWENQRCIKEFLLAYEQLNRAAKMLTVEKEELLNIEEELRFMLTEEIESKRQRNLTLRREVEEQKRKCVELTKILNSSIRGQ